MAVAGDRMKLGIIMDPIRDIKIHKDSSFAMLLASQSMGWENYYLEQNDLLLQDGEALGTMCKLRVMDDPSGWFEMEDAVTAPLEDLDIILMRKDPPVDLQYIHATQILEIAQDSGVTVINDPASLRDFNEKLFINWFPEFIVPTLTSCDADQLRAFIDDHEDVILKPLDGMGGASIFRVRKHDTNMNVIIETLTQHGIRFAMAQKFIPEIRDGDKRILLINGEPVPYALARIPLTGENRGNLAAGGNSKGVELSNRDREICEAIAPFLRENGLYFTGIDVIGDYLTEINITSPTCIRELDNIYSIDIARDLMEAIEKIHSSDMDN